MTITLDSCVSPLQRCEGFGLLFVRDHALDNAGAVAKNREEQLAGFAQVVEPAANRHRFSGVLTGLVDGDDWRGVGSGGLRLLGHAVVRFIGVGN